MAIPEHKMKVLLIGDAGVGKTTLVTRHRTGEFTKPYIATMGVDLNPVLFKTNKGLVTMNIWDCAGQKKLEGTVDEYYTWANVAIVMFDVTSRVSYRNSRHWINKIRAKLGPDFPIVLCGNKVDVGERRVSPHDIVEHRHSKCLGYFDISAKSNYNFEKPFLMCIRHFMGEDTILT